MKGWVVPGFVHVRQVRVDPVGRRVVARHRMTRRFVSVTYLSQEFLADVEFRTRFRAESGRLAEIRDARVARLRQYVECGDGAAVVADHVEGPPLRALLIEEGAITAEAAVVVFKDVLRGLAASHAADVAHGDLKPEDVFLTSAGRVRLTDFGLSTCDGRRLLAWSTPFYLAPEQWSGGPATPAGDLYAATATFFECLVGAPPFHADSPSALLALHERGVPPLDAVPGPVRHLVARGLAKDPASRPSAHRFLTHVEEAASHGLGPGWERRGRRELTRLLTGPPAPASQSDPTDRQRQPVRLTAALGGALVVAAGLSSPPLLSEPVPTGPIDGSGSQGGTQAVPTPRTPSDTAGDWAGTEGPVSDHEPDPQSVAMAEPVGSAIASAAQGGTMVATAPPSSSAPHQVVSAPERVPAEAGPAAPATASAEPVAVAATMSGPPAPTTPRSGSEPPASSEEEPESEVPSWAQEDPMPWTQEDPMPWTPEELMPWAQQEPSDQESNGLAPSTSEWPLGHEEDDECLPENADW